MGLHAGARRRAFVVAEKARRRTIFQVHPDVGNSDYKAICVRNDGVPGGKCYIWTRDFLCIIAAKDQTPANLIL